MPSLPFRKKQGDSSNTKEGDENVKEKNKDADSDEEPAGGESKAIMVLL